MVAASTLEELEQQVRGDEPHGIPVLIKAIREARGSSRLQPRPGFGDSLDGLVVVDPRSRAGGVLEPTTSARRAWPAFVEIHAPRPASRDPVAERWLQPAR